MRKARLGFIRNGTPTADTGWPQSIATSPANHPLERMSTAVERAALTLTYGLLKTGPAYCQVRQHPWGYTPGLHQKLLAWSKT